MVVVATDRVSMMCRALPGGHHGRRPLSSYSNHAPQRLRGARATLSVARRREAGASCSSLQRKDQAGVPAVNSELCSVSRAPSSPGARCACCEHLPVAPCDGRTSAASTQNQALAALRFLRGVDVRRWPARGRMCDASAEGRRLGPPGNRGSRRQRWQGLPDTARGKQRPAAVRLVARSAAALRGGPARTDMHRWVGEIPSGSIGPPVPSGGGAMCFPRREAIRMMRDRLYG